MKKIIIATFMLTVVNCMALGAEEGYKAPEVEGVNIPWKAIAIIALTLVGIVAATLKNPKRTQTELHVD